MFERASLQAIVDERATLPHVLSVVAPYSAELRPVGFGPSVPHYRVLIERAAFRLRVALVPDYLAVSLRAAVVAGATHNPTRLNRLTADLRSNGWDPQVHLGTDGFLIEATLSGAQAGLESDDLDNAAVAAVLMSEFVLDQLVITKPYGEMRPAVERPLGGETGEVWLYDPTERDRATQVHRSLENWLIRRLREADIEPLDAAGEPFFDVAWRTGDGLVVCEVKSSTNSETHQLRLGLGQVLQYRHLLVGVESTEGVWASILIERAPADHRWLSICEAHDVLLFWPDRWDEISARLLYPVTAA